MSGLKSLFKTLRHHLIWAVPCLIVATPLLFTTKSLDTSTVDLQEAFELLRDVSEKPYTLPLYVEAGYSPLGRSPTVDALLGDPLYIPQYGKNVANQLRSDADKGSLYQLSRTAFLAAGIPLSEPLPMLEYADVPESFTTQIDPALGRLVYKYWKTFSEVYRSVESILSGVTPQERMWLKEHADAFFFGLANDPNEYDFFTTESVMPLLFFQLASRVNLASLCDQSLRLCAIVDDFYLHAEDFALILPQKDFIWQEDGLKFILSHSEGKDISEECDFRIDLGGSNTYRGLTGGTGGNRAAALHIDLMGGNKFNSEQFAQGSGFLGVGIFSSLSGNNQFTAKRYSQGCGYYGVGILSNLGGNNQFEIDFGGQSFGLFGSSLLFNKRGSNTYIAHEGMAQAAASTLGNAFLIDREGHDVYQCGVLGKGGSRYGGIGQGGSSGVRLYPWINAPSFYGGLAFLYNGGGNNQFTIPWLGQGSAYMLSAGILVVDGSENNFKADYDAQGQGLHMAVGLLMERGSHNVHHGGWGSLGVAGDRSVGIFVGTEGNHTFVGTDQSIDTARKPKALGIFIETAGNNSYTFKNSSNANVQKPESPDEWPKALFLQLGGNNTYIQESDHLIRGSNKEWGIPGHSVGMDVADNNPNIEEVILDILPRSPRVPFAFNPFEGWPSNTAYRPLKTGDELKSNPIRVQKLLEGNYDERRQLYESIDLIRFTDRLSGIDLSEILKSPSNLPEDLFNFSVLWGLNEDNGSALIPILKALENDSIRSSFARRMALFYIGRFGSHKQIDPLLNEIINHDPSEENRYNAAGILATMPIPESWPYLQNALQSQSELVRYAAANNLRDNPSPGVLELVTPLFHDDSFYVRRAAAMTAISLHDKQAIPVLLETLKIETLDTSDNYGQNIYKELAQYLGVDFGLNQAAWQAWWDKNGEQYQFPNASAASKENMQNVF